MASMPQFVTYQKTSEKENQLLVTLSIYVTHQNLRIILKTCFAKD